MRTKKENAKKSSFVREFKSFEKALWQANNTTGERSRQTAAARKKIYNLLANAVLEKKAVALKGTDIDRVVDFLETDAAFYFNSEFDRTVSILSSLVAQNNMRACSVLADIYSCAWFEAPSGYRKLSRATLLYEKLAKDSDYGGYANARLAEIEKGYSGGGGEVCEHRNRARACAEKSATEFNSPFGLTLLGCWHYDGTIYDKDWVKAHDFLQRSYEVVKNWNGKRIKWETFYHYGWMLFYGQGCIANPKKGRKLIETSAENGFEPAKNWVEQEKNESTEPSQNSGDTPDESGSEKDEKRETATAGGKETASAAGANPMAPFSRKDRRKKGQIKTKKQLDALLKPLNDMIGCKPVKDEIESLVYMAHANALRERKGINTVPLTLHVAFLGSPGTGKTTVARMYAKILYELGFLSKGHLVECSRADLIGEYVGHTAPKVRAMVEKAVGGVLFVDEAYALHHDPDWDFGPEAITELMIQMENRRDNFVVVLAGYTDKMWAFLKVNPGLKSRIPNIVTFPDYKQPEMMEIFQKFVAERKFSVTPEGLTIVSDFLRRLDNESLRRFGNARLAREIFEDSLGMQARRIVTKGLRSKKALTTIEAEDIKLPADPTGKEKTGKNILRIVRDDDKK
ncbi:MAG TPA: AAA family ATPase [Patescibacteria group bacterium]|nr:AAA family ATPase [Patescibacteria group bacterium]